MTAHDKTPRLRHISLLQIYATLCVIGYHVGIRGVAFAGVVELFFVIAGFNMAGSLERYADVRSFIWRRASRLLPEVGFIWCVSLVCIIAGYQRWENGLFVCTAPLFLQNFIEPFFNLSGFVNWSYLLPLWFVAALMQLQVLLFIFRRHLLRSPVVLVLIVSLAVNALCAILTAELLGGLRRNLDYVTADTIYRLPFTHVTAMVIGVMLGLGRLKEYHRLFPVIAGVSLGAGALNLYSMHPAFPLSSLGYPVDMMFNYQSIWGYPLSALFMASLVAPGNWLAVTLAKIKMPAGLEPRLTQWSVQTYGAYVFHGLVLSTADYGLRRFGVVLSAPERLVFFLLVAAGSFFLAWLFQRLKQRIAVIRFSPAGCERREPFAEDLRTPQSRRPPSTIGRHPRALPRATPH